MNYGIIISEVSKHYSNEFVYFLSEEDGAKAATQELYVANSYDDAVKGLVLRETKTKSKHYSIVPITRNMCKALQEDKNAKYIEGK